MALFWAIYNLWATSNIPLRLFRGQIPTCLTKCEVHLIIFIIFWQDFGTLLLWIIDSWTQGYKPWRKATFWAYSSFMGIRIKRATKNIEHAFPMPLAHLLGTNWTTIAHPTKFSYGGWTSNFKIIPCSINQHLCCTLMFQSTLLTKTTIISPFLHLRPSKWIIQVFGFLWL